jgi:hypothetical protein
LYKEGEVAFDYGMFWFKGQKMGTGQCPVKAYSRKLLALIQEGKRGHPSLSRTSFRWTRPRMATSISTAAMTAGRPSSSIPDGART